jgi:hypothetical protein
MKAEQKIEYVTLEQLTNILRTVNRPMPVTFVAVTEVKMNKTNNPYFGRLSKKQKSNVFIKFDYANSVNKARLNEGKEADFVPQQRKWGVHIPNTPLIEHNGTYYLEARFLGSESKIDYLLDGNEEFDKKLIEEFLPKTSSSSNQDLEKEIVMRDFKLSGINEITMNGIRYIRSDV